MTLTAIDSRHRMHNRGQATPIGVRRTEDRDLHGFCIWLNPAQRCSHAGLLLRGNLEEQHALLLGGRDGEHLTQHRLIEEVQIETEGAILANGIDRNAIENHLDVANRIHMTIEVDVAIAHTVVVLLALAMNIKGIFLGGLTLIISPLVFLAGLVANKLWQTILPILMLACTL